MPYLFQNIQFVSPEDGIDTRGSFRLLENGVIESLVFNDVLRVHGDDREINGTEGPFAGLIVASGFFDMHCHFRQPGFEYKETLETGKNSAVAGGFTAVALMPNTEPPIDNAQNAAFVLHLTRDFPIDTVIIGAITEGRKGERIAGYGDMASVGVRAISDDGSPVMNSRTMRLGFEYASLFDLLVIQHCEDLCLAEGGVMNEGIYSSLLGLRGIPSISESLLLSRDLSLLRYLLDKKGGALPRSPRYHVAHISTKEGVELVRAAKREGLPVTCEVTPHHFTLTDEDVYHAEYDGNFRMNPPLRSIADKAAILDAIGDGTIDVIATDHAPHAPHEKECGIMQAAFGIVGLESAVGLAWNELVHKKGIPVMTLVKMLSSTPRRLMGLPPIRLMTNERANLTFILPEFDYEIIPSRFKSKSKNSPFYHTRVKGKAVGIVNRGQLHFSQEMHHLFTHHTL